MGQRDQNGERMRCEGLSCGCTLSLSGTNGTERAYIEQSSHFEHRVADGEGGTLKLCEM